MKILVISDTHGSIANVVKYIEKNEKPDMVFHLGDYVDDALRIKAKFEIPTKIVRGNGDYRDDGFKYEQVIELKGKKMLLTHGHKYDIHYSIDRLYYRGKELGVDYIFFGHTHVPIITKINGITLMNPGSTSRPRSMDNKKTLGIIKIGDTIEEKIIQIN